MDAAEFVRQQVAESRSLSDAAMSDLTDEQFNWLPPGTMNPIKAIYLHMASAEDSFVQKHLRGKTMVWTGGEWAAKLGFAQPPGRGQGWEPFRSAHLAVGPARAYAEEVCQATNDYLVRLTAEELDRPVSFYGRDWTVARVLALLVTHTACHAGEIAAVKGIQGVKGLPF
jgi:hypothetical protein